MSDAIKEEEMKIGYKTYPSTVEEWVRKRKLFIEIQKELLGVIEMLTDKVSK